MPKLNRVVVTGGAGFVGSHLVDALLETEVDEVVVLDNFARGRAANLSQRESDHRCLVIRGDIRDIDTVRRTLKGASSVYHLAAQATVMGAARDIDATFTTNVVGTYNVLRAAAEEGVRRLVFTSSREVYGEPVSLPVDESHPLLSINYYGASKVAGEALCRAAARESNLSVSILRLANVYGPRDFDRVIPHWIEQARRGDDLIVYGGQQVIDFVWVGHVARALVEAGIATVALPPINVASGTGTKIVDLAHRILSLSNAGGEIRILPHRPIEVVRFVGNTERMSHLLGLSADGDPLTHLDGMIRTVAGAAA